MKKLSTLILILFTFSINAQGPSLSFNVKPSFNYNFDKVPPYPIVQPHLSFSVKNYQTLSKHFDLVTELGYANFGITRRIRSPSVDQRTATFYEIREVEPSLFLNVGIQKKWNTINLSIAPLLVYQFYSDSYLSSNNTVTRTTNNELKDHLKYGFALSSEVQLIENEKNGSVWLEPFILYHQIIDKTNFYTKNSTNVFGCGINYRFN